MTHPPNRLRRRPLHQEPTSVTYAREKAGLTKRALAGLVGISEQLMGEIESGRRNATPDKLQRMAHALHCPVVVLERKRKYPQGATTGQQAPESVAYAREGAGLTRQALAELVGMSEELVKQIESGQRATTVEELQRLAEALNCPPILLQSIDPATLQESPSGQTKDAA